MTHPDRSPAQQGQSGPRPPEPGGEPGTQDRLSHSDDGGGDAGRRRPGPTALVEPMRRVLRAGALALAVALPVAVVLGFLIAGAPGAWGAGIGMGVAVGFFAVTVVVALATARLGPTQLGVWVLVSWLAKVVILIVVLALLRGEDFYSRPALFVALLVGTVGSLMVESLVVVRTRVPYVEPEPR